MPNPIEVLHGEFPDSRIDPPKNPDGTWFLDIRIPFQGRMLVITWLPPDTFSFSATTEDTGYGEGPDEIHSSIEPIRDRIKEWLTPALTDEEIEKLDPKVHPQLTATVRRLAHYVSFWKTQTRIAVEIEREYFAATGLGKDPAEYARKHGLNTAHHLAIQKIKDLVAKGT